MQIVFITLAFSAIIAQMPHAYVAIIWNSHIENKRLKVVQALAFCLIISTSILAFVLEGLHEYALGGAICEVVINIYYYGQNQRERHWKDKLKKNWFQYFLAVLLPTLIFIFSHMITLVG